MTSYTKVSDDERPVITVDALHTIARIEDNTYGGFTEHMGRCIYGGIYDPGNPLSDEDGFRKDVIEAIKELNQPVMRYPGGNFVATYHWMDGIGPREKRPRKQELAWVSVESNEFGTDEFLRWCEKVGTEPYFALNFGTGTLDEALGWIEYCNSSADTYYANLRRKNGREKPYNVKYWALGNEMWGAWQVGQMKKENYADQAYQWAKAIKLLDPSVVLILCGDRGYTTWDQYVIKECIRTDTHALGGSTTQALIDMHSIHVYTSGDTHLKNVTAPRSAERAIKVSVSMIDLARIENKVPNTVPRQKICFDEWNVWDPRRAPGNDGAEEAYNLSDALAVAAWLNVFIRQAEHIGMANIAQSVNVISPLMTTKDGIEKQPTWWPFLLFCKYMRGQNLAVNVRCAEYEGPTRPDWIRGTCETPYLDVSAALGDDGLVNLAVVNIREDMALETMVKGVPAGAKVEVHQVTGEDVKGRNVSVDKSEVDWPENNMYKFPAASFTLLRFKPE